MEKFLHLYFKGGRYDHRNGVPIEALKHLGALDDLVRSLAHDLFLDGNPRRRRVSTGFDLAFVPSITSLQGGGSADVDVSWQPELAGEHAGVYEDAQVELVNLLQSFTLPDPVVPSWVSRTSLEQLGSVLAAVNERETVAWTVAGRDPVVTSFRDRLRVEREARRPLQEKIEPYQVVGQLHLVDDKPARVALLVREGGRDMVVPIEPALKLRCLAALSQNEETLVRLTGKARRDERGRRFESADDIKIIAGPPIRRRILELSTLTDGWLANDEEGRSYAPKMNFLQRVEEHLWNLIESTGCARPHLFAMPDGGVEALWRTSSLRVSVRFGARPRSYSAVRVALESRRSLRAEFGNVDELAAWLPTALETVA